MGRKFLAAVVLLMAVVALAVGSVSAFVDAGSTNSITTPVVGSEEADGLAVEAHDVDEQEADEGNDGDGAERIAGLIEEAFGAEAGSVSALHEQGIGFGALFKLYLLAAATDMSVDELLATATNADDGHGFAFGRLFREMADEVSALSAEEDGTPRNLGKLVSSANEGSEDALLTVEDENDEDAGGGPPDHAPAHGRR